jgi:hypothetical protein
MFDELKGMTPADLKAGVEEYFRGPQQPAPAPLPAGVDRAALRPDVAAAASELYVTAILERKKPEHWTPEERDAVRQALGTALSDAYGPQNIATPPALTPEEKVALEAGTWPGAATIQWPK